MDLSDSLMMYPNPNFLKYFPEVELPEEKEGSKRSSCLRIGTYVLIRKIIADYGLDEMMKRIIGKNSGLFLNLAAYSIISENNAGQYYPDYGYNHPLFTDKMRIYSDSKVSDFITGITLDQSVGFLNEWNARRDHRILRTRRARPAISGLQNTGIRKTGRIIRYLTMPSRMTGITVSRSFMKSILAELWTWRSFGSCWTRQRAMATKTAVSFWTGAISARPICDSWIKMVMIS